MAINKTGEGQANNTVMAVLCNGFMQICLPLTYVRGSAIMANECCWRQDEETYRVTQCRKGRSKKKSIRTAGSKSRIVVGGITPQFIAGLNKTKNHVLFTAYLRSRLCNDGEK